MKKRSRRRLILLCGIGLLLLIPLIAMQFTSEVVWGWGDFMAAFLLLLGTGLLVERIVRTVARPQTKWFLMALVVLGALLLWVELGVGLFGSPFAGN